MSISLEKTDASAVEGEPDGHDYRLTPDQFARTIAAGILPEADRVELLDGFLRFKRAEGGPLAGTDYRLGVDQYRAMAREDILTTEDRIELLEGWLVAKMTKHPPHEIAKGLAQDALTASAPMGWFVAIESPTGTPDSEPEPDLMIVRGPRRRYSERTPGPQDVALVVEVADSSLARDRNLKKRLYARSGFPVYWLINLVDRRIEVYTEPSGPIAKPNYARREDFGPAEAIPLVIEGRVIGRIVVGDLLP